MKSDMVVEITSIEPRSDDGADVGFENGYTWTGSCHVNLGKQARSAPILDAPGGPYSEGDQVRITKWKGTTVLEFALVKD